MITWRTSRSRGGPIYWSVGSPAASAVEGPRERLRQIFNYRRPRRSGAGAARPGALKCPEVEAGEVLPSVLAPRGGQEDRPTFTSC